MAIVTITSDLGDNSHYPAVVKGIILSLYPGVTLVDVTHNVPNFDVMQAAYIVRHMFHAFPAGSIHLISVDPDSQSPADGVVMAYREHFFVGPNNGLMSLITHGEPAEAMLIQHPGLIQAAYPRSFRAARLFAPAAAFLASGGPLEEVGERVALRELRWGEPSYSGNCLRGKIIHIDKFGNAVTNIHRANFLDLKQQRRFEIFIRNVRLRRIVNTYADVAKADALAIFGESEHLEIAMREASAAELLGLKVHDMITIEFSG